MAVKYGLVLIVLRTTRQTCYVLRTLLGQTDCLPQLNPDCLKKLLIQTFVLDSWKNVEEKKKEYLGKIYIVLVYKLVS